MAAGGVGTAALQLARAAGAEVVGTSRTAEKLERARGLGLAHAVDASAEGWEERVAAALGGRGVDVVLDLVGGEYTPRSLALLAPRGRLVVVGLVAGAAARLDLGLVLRRRLHVIGTVLRSRPLEEKIALARGFSREMLPRFEDGALRPIVDSRYPFAQVAQAQARMEANANVGKVLLDVNPPNL